MMQKSNTTALSALHERGLHLDSVRVPEDHTGRTDHLAEKPARGKIPTPNWVALGTNGSA